jgi:hypothetical protein
MDFGCDEKMRRGWGAWASVLPDQKKETSALFLSFHILHRN